MAALSHEIPIDAVRIFHTILRGLKTKGSLIQLRYFYLFSFFLSPTSKPCFLRLFQQPPKERGVLNWFAELYYCPCLLPSSATRFISPYTLRKATFPLSPSFPPCSIIFAPMLEAWMQFGLTHSTFAFSSASQPSHKNKKQDTLNRLRVK
jgi:hypothetical protein